VYRLRFHESAEDDLEDIQVSDPDGAYLLLTLLEELQGDQDLLDRLSQHGYDVRDSDDWAANFNVKEFVSQQKQGRNLWRLRAWDFGASLYRVVYAFQPQLRTYVVLGVFHKRHFDYEPENPLTRRVVADYEDLRGW